MGGKYFGKREETIKKGRSAAGVGCRRRSTKARISPSWHDRLLGERGDRETERKILGWGQRAARRVCGLTGNKLSMEELPSWI